MNSIGTLIFLTNYTDTVQHCKNLSLTLLFHALNYNQRLWNALPKENTLYVNFYDFVQILLEFRLSAKATKDKKRVIALEEMLISKYGDDILPHNRQEDSSCTYIEGAQYLPIHAHIGERYESQPMVIEGTVSVIDNLGDLNRFGHDPRSKPGSMHMIPLPKVKSIYDYLVPRYPDNEGIEEFSVHGDPGGIEDYYEKAFKDQARLRMSELPSRLQVGNSPPRRDGWRGIEYSKADDVVIVASQNSSQDERVDSIYPMVVNPGNCTEGPGDEGATENSSINDKIGPLDRPKKDAPCIVPDHIRIGCCIFSGDNLASLSDVDTEDIHEEEHKMYQYLLVPPVQVPEDYLYPRFPVLSESNILQHTMY